MSEENDLRLRPLRLIEGGGPVGMRERGALGRTHGGRAHSRRRAGGIAEELSGPIREAERRIGLLLAGDYGPLRDLQKEELLAAAEAAEFLSSVLSLVGLTEREDTGAKEKEEAFDLRFATWDVVEEHSCRVRLKRVRLELSLPSKPLWVRGNRCVVRAVLRFAFRERLHSASKGGRILVRGEEEGGGAVLRIESRAGDRATGGEPACRAALSLADGLLAGCDGHIDPLPAGWGWRLRFPSAGESRGRPSF